MVWQFENFSYLSLSNICQAAYHSNIFSNQTEKLLSVFFKGQIARVYNETIVSQNGISTLLWPPSGLKNVSIRLSILKKYDLFYFRGENLVKKQKRIEEASCSLDVLVKIKAVHAVKSKKNLNMSIDVTIYFYHEISPRSLEFHLKRLIPNDESFVTYKKYISAKISNGTLVKVKENLTEVNLNLGINHFDQLKMLNNYFEVMLLEEEDKGRSKCSLKFPINFVLNSFSFQNFHTIRLGENETQVLSLMKRLEHECNWFLMNIDMKVSCNTSLSINYDLSLKFQNYVVYPHAYKSNFNVFTRVIAVTNDETLNCLNFGVFKDGKCLCLPGLYGPLCEKICYKGFFGNSCELKCPNLECEGNLICGKDPLGCSCLPGYKGFECNQQCSKNEWGPDCKLKCALCKDNLCDRFTGDCICSNNSKGKIFNN